MPQIEIKSELSETRRENSDDERYHQQFSVKFNYPVIFTADVFHPQNNQLMDTIDRFNENRRHRIMVFIDSGVVDSTPGILERIDTYFDERKDRVTIEDTIKIVPGGEQGKTGWRKVKQLVEMIADRHLCRQSFIIVIGGGSVLDIVGFAASLVHRGLRQIRIPTTVLAQNDAGVGVKNGIDHHGVKNFAGTFSPPFAVLNDHLFLRTLPDKYWLGGIAEAFKVAIIKDREFFDFLSQNSCMLKNRNEAIMKEVIKRCAIHHLEHIKTGGDPFEFGAARPLDFGHWCAHKLEVLSGYDISHGQAVAMGIALDSCYAYQIGHIKKHERDGILDALDRTGLPIWCDYLEARDPSGEMSLFKGIGEFREHLGGKLHITLPKGIGEKIEVHQMDSGLLLKAIHHLKERAFRQ